MNDSGRVLFLELYRLDTYVCAGMYMPWVRMGVLFPLYVYPLSLGFTRSSVSSLQSAFTSGGQLLNSIVQYRVSIKHLLFCMLCYTLSINILYSQVCRNYLLVRHSYARLCMPYWDVKYVGRS